MSNCSEFAAYFSISPCYFQVVCIELNIPLFIVGHPGSSKSLAKLIVKECMSGLSSNSQLLDHLCQIHMTSFQVRTMLIFPVLLAVGYNIDKHSYRMAIAILCHFGWGTPYVHCPLNLHYFLLCSANVVRFTCHVHGYLTCYCFQFQNIR